MHMLRHATFYPTRRGSRDHIPPDLSSAFSSDKERTLTPHSTPLPTPLPPTSKSQPRLISFLRSQLSPRHTFGHLLVSWSCGVVAGVSQLIESEGDTECSRALDAIFPEPRHRPGASFHTAVCTFPAATCPAEALETEADTPATGNDQSGVLPRPGVWILIEKFSRCAIAIFAQYFSLSVGRPDCFTPSTPGHNAASRRVTFLRQRLLSTPVRGGAPGPGVGRRLAGDHHED